MPRSKGAALLAARSDRKSVVVSVPEWGTQIELRAFTARQRAEFIAKGADLKGNRAEQLRLVQPWVIIESAHDSETGEQLFTHEDGDALLERDPAVLDRLSAAALTVSGMGEGSREEAGKGSAPTATGASSSVSLSPSAGEPSPSSSEPSGATSSPSGRSSPRSSRSAPDGKSTARARS